MHVTSTLQYLDLHSIMHVMLHHINTDCYKHVHYLLLCKISHDMPPYESILFPNLQIQCLLVAPMDWCDTKVVALPKIARVQQCQMPWCNQYHPLIGSPFPTRYSMVHPATITHYDPPHQPGNQEVLTLIMSGTCGPVDCTSCLDQFIHDTVPGPSPCCKDHQRSMWSST